MSKVFVTAAEAAALIPRRRKIHTFIRIFGWMGADVDREKLLAAFNTAKQVEISQEASCFDHYLAVKIDGMVTYIETNLKALAKSGLLPPQRKVA
ncbi:hypothetical protein [Cupriavidus plantarum]|uniref:hypothetical protein n=1 Tax=Cupriavidus plantarum TaxID=942865 RepID=UPI0015CE0A9B|nr:hypothetical protein [Cupriavidus plantarum]NYI02879.1 hypothetical protein [Cupriavidus plantarum]